MQDTSNENTNKLEKSKKHSRLFFITITILAIIFLVLLFNGYQVYKGYIAG